MNRVPGITIATDIICGFPGETEADFEETLELVRRYRFPSLFINQFYPRPGTPAAKMEQVAAQVKKQRTKALSQLFHSYNPYDHKISLSRCRYGISSLDIKLGRPVNALTDERINGFRVMRCWFSLEGVVHVQVKCLRSTFGVSGKALPRPPPPPPPPDVSQLVGVRLNSGLSAVPAT
ncbi:hypothetical protein NHX12_000801 [Muraenolepis orangiensis]|uniref:Radical SAM core domain-containing protein n=1 Tax=Muraenolepis orangiensis TaxID=630683 RepID=A0A9Q0E188_9TELE|nr:hypothetical protein NHX12_000801 [Muraenolepis orangiensis]